MKKSDIQIGAEYAVNPRGYARQGQTAGDRGLARGVIHSYVEGRYSNPGAWLVTMPDGYAYYDGQMRDVGGTVTISSRNIVAPWDEHVVASKRREENEAASAKQQAERKARDEAALAELRSLVPNDLLPYWARDDRSWSSFNGQVTVHDLLAIIAHAKQ